MGRDVGGMTETSVVWCRRRLSGHHCPGRSGRWQRLVGLATFASPHGPVIASLAVTGSQTARERESLDLLVQETEKPGGDTRRVRGRGRQRPACGRARPRGGRSLLRPPGIGKTANGATRRKGLLVCAERLGGLTRVREKRLERNDAPQQPDLTASPW